MLGWFLPQRRDHLKKVLVLDDEQDLLELWPWHFKMWGGEVELFKATNGAEGIDLINAHGSFDLIITDFKMPKVDGLRFISYVREKDKHTPIILFSAYTPELLSQLEKLEKVTFFEKPSITGKIQEYIQDWLMKNMPD